MVVYAADQCTWTTVGPDGRGLNADVLELGADDREEELVVEVHNAEGLVASGTVPMVDLWQVILTMDHLTECLRIYLHILSMSKNHMRGVMSAK